MAVRRFQVSTRATGTLRIAKVIVFDTAQQMRHHLTRYSPGCPPSYFDDAGASTSFRDEWDDRDPRPFQATIYLNHEHLNLTTIAHECTHVALHFYQIDGYREHARASAHMHGGNEPAAYAMSELFSAVIWHFETIEIGHGSDYKEPHS